MLFNSSSVSCLLVSSVVFCAISQQVPLLIVFFVEILFVRIGMSDLAEEGVYVWEDGSPVTYKRFAPFQPDNYFDEDFMILQKADGDFSDAECDKWKTFFICKTDQNRLFS